VTVVVITFVRPDVSDIGVDEPLPDVRSVLPREALPTQLLQLALNNAASQTRTDVGVRRRIMLLFLMLFRIQYFGHVMKNNCLQEDII